MATDPQSWIDLVLSRADELRAKGVLSIAADGFAVTFDAGYRPAPTTREDAAETDDEVVDPFSDPRSYPGGYVPGFEITRFTDPEE